MADDRAYRIHVAYMPEKERFRARVPELGLEVSGDSRASAVAEAEAQIEARIAEAAGAGEELPTPVDQDEVSGELRLKLPPPIHRELLFHARQGQMDLESFASHLLSRAVGALETGARMPRRDRSPAQEPQEKRDEDRQPEDPRGDRQDSRRPGGRGRRDRQEGYRPDLNNKANFLEYLRSMEKGPGRGRR